MAAHQELSGQFGRYRILRKLGAGGMGAVYLAEDSVLGRQVALKVPHFDADTKPAVFERFRREARLAASIDHPNLCAVHDVGEVGGIHYFTMPFIEGTPLSDRIDEKRPWNPAEAVELVRKVALAVGKLHQNGIVHRDLKPANILVREGGEPVLMDLGLARSFTAETQRLTKLGTVLGSPPYMAPEQVSASKDVGPAADVYGLGVILYELLTGRRPFEAPTLLVLFAKILNEPVPPPSSRRPGLDPRLEALCLKALAKDPRQRFADTAALAAALAETARQLSFPVAQLAPQTQPAGIVTMQAPQAAVTVDFPPTVAPGQETQPELPLLTCPKCRARVKVTSQAVGHRVRCSKCQTSLGRVPSPGQTPAAPAGPGTAQSSSAPAPEVQSGRWGWLMPTLALIPCLALAGILLFVALGLRKGSGQRRPGEDRGSTLPLPRTTGTTSPPAVPPAGRTTLPGPSLEIDPLDPLTLQPGETRLIAIRVSRRDCPGPITLELARPAAGVTVLEGLVRKDETEGSVKVRVSADAAPGRQTLRLRASGVIDAEADLVVTVMGIPLRAHALDLGGVKMEFVFVGKGTFWMGSPADEKDRYADEEQKEVTIGHDFYIGKYEVTQEQWEAVMGKGTNPSYFSRTGAGKDRVKDISDEELRQFPVENVSWDDIQTFLKKLNEREKDRNSGWEYRLPREAEWEYSCRGGPISSEEGRKTAPFYFARPTFSLSSDQANFVGKYPYGGAPEKPSLNRPTKVGSYKPNALGIYDLHGNVWEWCDDLYQAGPGRVHRGGSWGSNGQNCRAAIRSGLAPDIRDSNLGFRLARVPSSSK